MIIKKEIGESLKKAVEEVLYKRVDVSINEGRGGNLLLPSNYYNFLYKNFYVFTYNSLYSIDKNAFEKLDPNNDDDIRICKGKVNEYVTIAVRTLVENAMGACEETTTKGNNQLTKEIEFEKDFILVELLRMLEECSNKGEYNIPIGQNETFECDLDKDKTKWENILEKVNESKIAEKYNGRRYDLNSVLYINIRKKLATRAVEFWRREIISSRKSIQDYCTEHGLTYSSTINDLNDTEKKAKYDDYINQMLGRFIALNEEEYCTQNGIKFEEGASDADIKETARTDIIEKSKEIRSKCFGSVRRISNKTGSSCEVLDKNKINNALENASTSVLLEAFMRARVPRPTIDNNSSDNEIKEIKKMAQAKTERIKKEILDLERGCDFPLANEIARQYLVNGLNECIREAESLGEKGHCHDEIE